jgi:murein DD-endopeptidase MepM/ murein hydrolase activator NlpD
MSGKQRDLTLLVMTGETAPVKRLRLRRAWLERGAIGLGVFALALSVGLVDYVRLRGDVSDIERMRAENVRHREELKELAGRVGGIAQEFEQLRELERKVRVIANLPASTPEARIPNNAGQGGAEDTDAADDVAPVAPLEPAEDSAEDSAEPVSADAQGPDAELRAAIERIEKRARKMASLLPDQRASLTELVGGLEGRREQLASTPSIWPANGWVTSGYGTRISPFTGRPQFHAGIDIAADFGTPIIAPASGRVVLAGRKGAFGRVVEIDHGFGIRTLYGHTDEVFVRAGQRVERGTRIASVGSSGRSTGPHVHYQVKVGGRTVNPGDYIFE